MKCYLQQTEVEKLHSKNHYVVLLTWQYTPNIIESFFKFSSYTKVDRYEVINGNIYKMPHKELVNNKRGWSRFIHNIIDKHTDFEQRVIYY